MWFQFFPGWQMILAPTNRTRTWNVMYHHLHNNTSIMLPGYALYADLFIMTFQRLCTTATERFYALQNPIPTKCIKQRILYIPGFIYCILTMELSITFAIEYSSPTSDQDSNFSFCKSFTYREIFFTLRADNFITLGSELEELYRHSVSTRQN